MKSTRLFTRRGFIKSAAMAGALPLILPAGLRGADTPPRERITMGIIGNGTQGKILTRGFLSQRQTRVVAVCDVDTDRRKNAQSIVENSYAADTTAGTYK